MKANIMENINAYLTFLVAVGSSLTTLWVSKLNSKKDLTINDRTSLSEDEKDFRRELRETINQYNQELKNARGEIVELRKEVSALHKINIRVTLENKKLHTKVGELTDEVKSLRGELKQKEEQKGVDLK